MTTAKHWTLEDIPWDRFDRSLVDADILKVVKAAALVEYNADDYAAYLCNVFHDDDAFRGASVGWAQEEVQHGTAISISTMRSGGFANPIRSMCRRRHRRAVRAPAN
jgi:hypothetical protein